MYIPTSIIILLIAGFVLGWDTVIGILLIGCIIYFCFWVVIFIGGFIITLF